MPISKQVLGESFIDEEELATKILPGCQQIEGVDAFDEEPNKRKRKRESEERQGVKRFNGGPFKDSLPTPWKVDSYVEGPFKITREERLVREEKYTILTGTSLQSIDDIKDEMFNRGWNLKYATVSNSDDIVVKIPSKFGHNFQDILEDLKQMLTVEMKSSN
ncbi:hypothetical protein CDV36_014321 [Fusarium kuroshium]|uniref:Uncharacterized protein n=2 Tax=Fusarium solani species complex TaxID=232080 RepID=A0A3M2RIH5_9HYPO|nr:hypothetical protein CDV36_014321 [Fusarium kuroshium]RSL48005.1 hypothetical protein CEP51_015699 [Fusarium floridanum]